MNPINKTKKPFSIQLLILTSVIILLIATWMLTFAYENIVSGYEKTVIEDSSDGLQELNAQLKLYIDGKLEDYWKVAQSVANRVGVFSDTDEKAIIEHLKQEQLIWNLSDIFIYTEDGRSISARAERMDIDLASELIYQATQNHRFISLVRSSISFSVPVTTQFMYKGSKVVAISVVQDLETFIDKMKFSAYDDEAYLYLTQNSGTVISIQTHAKAQTTYNVLTLFSEQNPTLIYPSDYSLDQIGKLRIPSTFLTTVEGKQNYVAMVPIDATDISWKLFLVVSKDVVDAKSNVFSTKLKTLTYQMVLGFVLVIILCFSFVIIDRNRKYSRSIRSRELMFNMLVNNSPNAFELLSTKQIEPIFISDNVKRIIGDDYMYFSRDEKGKLAVHNSSGKNDHNISILNSEISQWDEENEFISSFLPYADETSNRFMIVKIYPNKNVAETFIMMIQDVTTEKERENILKNALAMADSANIAKTKFLSSMSHDIRTPMNAIVNMTRFAINEIDDSTKVMEYLNTINEASIHLLKLINDVLDMSRIESGKAVIAEDPINLKKCLDSIVEVITPLSKAKNQTLTANFTNLTHLEVLGDQVKITQIFTNLLNNAVKFTPMGGKIFFNAREDSSLKNDIASFHFVVKDNGIGISKSDLARIFDPFTRNESALVNQIEGTGLGLSICKNYVSAMGGSIFCRSQLDVGSSFTVDLSLKLNPDVEHVQETPDKQIVKIVSFTGRRALLVEDNEINRRIAQILLKNKGLEVEFATNGREAVDKFVQSSNGHFDIIFMDIQMPVLNGYDATRQIRASKHPQAYTIPIIAMTANVFADDIEKSRVSGMNGHIGKPIDVEELMAEITKNLEP